MVRIAIAGGSGEVAQEIIDVLAAAKKHEIIILSRNVRHAPKFLSSAISNVHQKPHTEESSPEVTWRSVNYEDKNDLVEALQRVHTLLSFLQLLGDPESKTQKNLVDAAIIAGVTRFAPSEWGSAETVGLPWWAGKQAMKEYLEKLNETEKVIEYTLFQPGLFLDYLAYPHKTAKHLTPLNTFIDFEHRRAIVVDGHDALLTLTTIKDVAAVVARAVDYEGEWPVISGICGNKVTVSQILEIGESVRGCAFSIDKVKLEDLEAGELKTSWTLEARHPSFTGNEVAAMLKTVLIGTLVSSAKGAWAVSDTVNQLFPDFEFTAVEDFLAQAWNRKAE
ncbi:Fc.00g057080.m01.CDS01 [Cosmosporella sp. VM-42]